MQIGALELQHINLTLDNKIFWQTVSLGVKRGKYVCDNYDRRSSISLNNLRDSILEKYCSD